MSRCRDCRMEVPSGAYVCPFCRSSREWDARQEQRQDREFEALCLGLFVYVPPTALVTLVVVVFLQLNLGRLGTVLSAVCLAPLAVVVWRSRMLAERHRTLTGWLCGINILGIIGTFMYIVRSP